MAAPSLGQVQSSFGLIGEVCVCVCVLLCFIINRYWGIVTVSLRENPSLKLPQIFFWGGGILKGTWNREQGTVGSLVSTLFPNGLEVIIIFFPHWWLSLYKLFYLSRGHERTIISCSVVHAGGKTLGVQVGRLGMNKERLG